MFFSASGIRGSSSFTSPDVGISTLPTVPPGADRGRARRVGHRGSASGAPTFSTTTRTGA